MNDMSASYFAGRLELRKRCLASLVEHDLPESALNDVFWETIYADEQGEPHELHGGPLPNHKFNVSDFSGTVSANVETVGSWKRLCVTNSRVITLSDYADQEAWFSSLSQKNRKKLRWLRNAVPKLGAQVVPLETEIQFDQFEQLYSAQFPQHPFGSIANKAVRNIYHTLIRQKLAMCRLLTGPGDQVLSACLAYRYNDAVFYTHLTRAYGEYDKFSPGYYLTYMVISELLSMENKPCYFFLGPGEYDYKQALGGVEYPVFRYERNSWTNLFGLIRLYHRAAKERRKLSKKE